MTAQVEFFCSPSEERDVLQYLSNDPGTLVYDVTDGRMQLCDQFSVNDISEPPYPLQLYFHQPDHGGIIWHTTRPSVTGPTHGSLVKNLFAAEEWDNRGLTSLDKMVDSDLSPVLCYKRGVKKDSRIGQNTVLAAPSSLNRVGPEYEKWVKRCLAWMRRRSTIVHDYRKQSSTIPNPHSIVNTIYAFPDVLTAVQSSNHRFAILIDGGT